ncbi:Whi2 protein [Saccharomycopsis crataegensis]|uniref:Whi2 protein n=1 Tax=Saccharomycopsis crataegensis TaxID=43959 RepID=A0AAV5QW41_9ASCO|nr:Whi2 protein [Saccharomycopsis crataegensis]
MANIITQVSQDSGAAIQVQEEDDFNAIINLNVRNTSFQITRDELMSLPESILLCLFPNGVFLDDQGQVITNLTENDVVYVDFSPECFQYILQSFSKAAASMPATNNNNDYYYDSGDEYRPLDSSVLKTKPCVIVLREDLDFYCIPPTTGLSSQDMKKIKLSVARQLVQHDRIFEGLGYKEGKPLGPAEQHLLDMLCHAGYTTTDAWGHRDVESNKSVVSSLALVQLKADGEGDANSKLLLFWKKPARKCWWSNEVLELLVNEVFAEPVSVKVHIRRVWTLELAVLSSH